jgi:hypothetical protein
VSPIDRRVLRTAAGIFIPYSLPTCAAPNEVKQGDC